MRYGWMLGFVALWTNSGYAQGYAPPRAVARAGAYRAAAEGAEALYLNPAGLALSGRFDLELAGLDDLSGDRRQLSVAATDGRAGPISGALGYAYVRAPSGDADDDTARWRSHRLDAAVAGRLSDQIAIGVAGRHLRRSGAGARRSLWSWDAGLTMVLNGGLRLAAVGQNLGHRNREEAPFAWGGALAYVGGGFGFEASGMHQVDQRRADLATGLSVAPHARVLVSGGVAHRTRVGHWLVSGGLTIRAPPLAFSAAFRQRVDGDRGADDERIFGLALTIDVGNP